MAVQGKELAVGQHWVTNAGARVRLVARDTVSGAYEGTNNHWYSPEGAATDMHGVYQYFENLGRFVGMFSQQVPPHRPPAQHDSAKVHAPLSSAPDLLSAAAGHMLERAATYDKPEGERSMARTVAAFNAQTGRDLTESEGWLLLSNLKVVRDRQRTVPHRDSIEDGIAYSALYGEARLKEVAQ